MWVKIKRWTFPVVFLVFLLSTTIFLLRQEEYRLNRTVRNVALRLVQVETLSRTTRVDYRLRFWNNVCKVERFDRSTGLWMPYVDTPYSRGIVSQPLGLQVIFSQGHFREYRLEGGPGKTPRYVIVEFKVSGTDVKRGIIFYQDGSWRVLK